MRHSSRPWNSFATGEAVPPPHLSLPATPPRTPRGLLVDKQPPPPRATRSDSARVVTLRPHPPAEDLPFDVEPLTPEWREGGNDDGDGGGDGEDQGHGGGRPGVPGGLPDGHRPSAAAVAWWGGWGGSGGGRGGAGRSGGSDSGGGGGSGVRRLTLPVWADDRPGDSLDWEDLDGDADVDGRGHDGGGPPDTAATAPAGLLSPAGAPVGESAAPPPRAVLEDGRAMGGVAVTTATLNGSALGQVAEDDRAMDAAAAEAAAAVQKRATPAVEASGDMAAATAGPAASPLRLQVRSRPRASPGSVASAGNGGGPRQGVLSSPAPRRRAPSPGGSPPLRVPPSTTAHGSAPPDPTGTPPPLLGVTPAAVEAIGALAAALPPSVWARGTPDWRAGIAAAVTALLFPSPQTPLAAATGGGAAAALALPSVLSPAVLTPLLHRTATAHGFPLVEVWLPVMVTDGAPGRSSRSHPPTAATAAAVNRTAATNSNVGAKGSGSGSSNGSSGGHPPPATPIGGRCSHLRLGWTTVAPSASAADAAALPRYAARVAGTTFRPAVGLPGRVYVTRRPEALGRHGLADRRRFRRAAAAAAAGLGAAFAVPLLTAADAVAAVVLFGRVGEPPGGDAAVAAAVDEVRGWARLLGAVAG